MGRDKKNLKWPWGKGKDDNEKKKKAEKSWIHTLVKEKCQ